MLNCLFFRIFSSVRMKWVWASARFEAFGREPACRRLAKCDAGSSQTGGFFPAAAGILCIGSAYCIRIFLRCPHGGATLAFAPLLRTHSQPAWKAAHSGDTRLTARCRCSAHPQPGCKTAHSGNTRLTARCRRSPHPQGRSCRLFSRAENRHDRHV